MKELSVLHQLCAPTEQDIFTQICEDLTKLSNQPLHSFSLLSRQDVQQLQSQPVLFVTPVDEDPYVTKNTQQFETFIKSSTVFLSHHSHLLPDIFVSLVDQMVTQFESFVKDFNIFYPHHLHSLFCLSRAALDAITQVSFYRMPASVIEPSPADLSGPTSSSSSSSLPHAPANPVLHQTTSSTEGGTDLKPPPSRTPPVPTQQLQELISNSRTPERDTPDPVDPKRNKKEADKQVSTSTSSSSSTHQVNPPSNDSYLKDRTITNSRFLSTQTLSVKRNIDRYTFVFASSLAKFSLLLLSIPALQKPLEELPAALFSQTLELAIWSALSIPFQELSNAKHHCSTFLTKLQKILETVRPTRSLSRAIKPLIIEQLQRFSQRQNPHSPSISGPVGDAHHLPSSIQDQLEDILATIVGLTGRSTSNKQQLAFRELLPSPYFSNPDSDSPLFGALALTFRRHPPITVHRPLLAELVAPIIIKKHLLVSLGTLSHIDASLQVEAFHSIPHVRCINCNYVFQSPHPMDIPEECTCENRWLNNGSSSSSSSSSSSFIAPSPASMSFSPSWNAVLPGKREDLQNQLVSYLNKFTLHATTSFFDTYYSQPDTQIHTNTDQNKDDISPALQSATDDSSSHPFPSTNPELRTFLHPTVPHHPALLPSPQTTTHPHAPPLLASPSSTSLTSRTETGPSQSLTDVTHSHSLVHVSENNNPLDSVSTGHIIERSIFKDKAVWTEFALALPYQPLPSYLDDHSAPACSSLQMLSTSCSSLRCSSTLLPELVHAHEEDTIAPSLNLLIRAILTRRPNHDLFLTHEYHIRIPLMTNPTHVGDRPDALIWMNSAYVDTTAARYSDLHSRQIALIVEYTTDDEFKDLKQIQQFAGYAEDVFLNQKQRQYIISLLLSPTYLRVLVTERPSRNNPQLNDRTKPSEEFNYYISPILPLNGMGLSVLVSILLLPASHLGLSTGLTPSSTVAVIRSIVPLGRLPKTRGVESFVYNFRYLDRWSPEPDDVNTACVAKCYRVHYQHHLINEVLLNLALCAFCDYRPQVKNPPLIFDLSSKFINRKLTPHDLKKLVLGVQLQTGYLFLSDLGDSLTTLMNTEEKFPYLQSYRCSH